MEPQPLHAPTNGPVWAAILAAGVGCATLGLTVDVAEAVPRVSRLLNLYPPTGDLSGKTGVAVIVWLVAWGLLHARWKTRDVRLPGMVLAVTLALIALAFLAVFPPVFGLFEHK